MFSLSSRPQQLRQPMVRPRLEGSCQQQPRSLLGQQEEQGMAQGPSQRTHGSFSRHSCLHSRCRNHTTRCCWYSSHCCSGTGCAGRCLLPIGIVGEEIKPVLLLWLDHTNFLFLSSNNKLSQLVKRWGCQAYVLTRKEWASVAALFLSKQDRSDRGLRGGYDDDSNVA